MAFIIMRKYIGKVAYPIGSIYCTNDLNATTTTIAELWGGTWTELEGRFLYGGGSSATLGAIGGSPNITYPSHSHALSHNHTITSSGTHRHEFGYTAKKVKKSGGINRPNDYGSTSSHQVSESISHTHTSNSVTVTATNPSGGHDATNGNLPPFIKTKMFVRVGW